MRKFLRNNWLLISLSILFSFVAAMFAALVFADPVPRIIFAIGLGFSFGWFIVAPLVKWE